MNSNMWMVKFRPTTFDDLILQPVHRELFDKYKQNGIFPHLILIGAKGTGKTSLANVLINEFNCEVLELNGSDDRGIDVVRETILQFLIVRTQKMKVVFCDEADKMTPDAFDALRNIMEKYSSVGRFILTGNYDKFPEPIVDRCKVLRFSYSSKSDIFEYVKKLLIKEGVECSDSILTEVVESQYPSFRHILNTLQDNVDSTADGKNIINKIIYSEATDFTVILKRAFELFSQNKIEDMREYLIDNSFYDYNLMYRFWMKVVKNPLYKVLIAEYAYRDTIMSDKELNFIGMCYALHTGAYPFTLKTNI